MRFEQLPTPCYVVDEALLEKNLRILRGVMEKSGCRILLAQKAFSMFAVYPLIGHYLCGAAASGLYEAKLAAEHLGGENHIFSPAYRQEDFAEIVRICDHIVFNSFNQLDRFGAQAVQGGRSIGMRINPQFSTQQGHEIYDPCSKGSRLGVTRANFPEQLPSSIEGLHFHTLCEQNADALLLTVEAVEEKFGQWLPQMRWFNFGGGHHITRSDYDIASLVQCITEIQQKYDVQVYLEPGEAIALNAGFLVTTVLEKIHNDLDIAILDTSAACHMPDVLEMPYRPPLIDSALANEKAYTYRLGGPTCLAGDIIGDYSFDRPLNIGDRLVFEDMAIYSMVKNNTFNGMPLPTIALREKNGNCRIIKSFGYEDFKMRLS